MSKKAFHRWNVSGELDVFEAAKYYSGHNEAASYINCATLISQKTTRDERQPLKGGRISLDVPMRRNPLLQPSHSSEKQVSKEKKHKKPSSPGGKLASFLNSLFNQTGYKKKKNSKSSTTTQSMNGEEESPSGGRRKRRMSISHFRSSNTVDTKSFYSSSSSGFRTPPPYAATPTKSYKGSDLLNGKKKEKSKFVDGILEKYKNLGAHHRDMNNRNARVDRYQSEEEGFRKFGEIDDGAAADSDSSSDLFELQSCDLGIYSTGLPVFETTNMDSFKRGAPVSNGAL